MSKLASADLASLLCSRLCHDLLSPIGALNNGLELLADERDPNMREKCIELLEQSARASANKLKFFRLAFGAAGGYGEMIEIEEARGAVEGLLQGNARIGANWAITESKLPKDAVKVMLNLAHIAIDALIRGGSLDIGAEASANMVEIVIAARGDKIAFDPDIGLALDGELPLERLSGRTAPAFMMRQITDDGGMLQYQLSADALILGAALPRPEGLIG